MKRACVAALLVLAAVLAAGAQNRSTAPAPNSPAASNSAAPARSFISATPPSWSPRARDAAPSGSSQTPRRWFIPRQRGPNWSGTNAFGPCSAGGISPLIPSAMGCTDTRFTSGFYYPDGQDRGPVNLQPPFYSYPAYAPYTYPVVVGEPPAPPVQVEEPEPPAPTIFERRAQSAPVPAHPTADPRGQHYVEQNGTARDREQVPTVLIFRDGHQTEVLNYAIVGQTLYDLGTFVAHKIPLADLNLKATIKANQERGVEFSPPAPNPVD